MLNRKKTKRMEDGLWTRSNFLLIVSKKTQFIEKSQYILMIHNEILTYVLYIALRLFGKDWKKVENHIKSRSGA